MEVVLWRGARRLAILVAVAIAVVVSPLPRHSHATGLFLGCAGLAVVLWLAAIVPLSRARRILRRLEPVGTAPAVAMAYRASARAVEDEPAALVATRWAAIALMLLAWAGALVIVAATSR